MRRWLPFVAAIPVSDSTKSPNVLPSVSTPVALWISVLHICALKRDTSHVTAVIWSFKVRDGGPSWRGERRHCRCGSVLLPPPPLLPSPNFSPLHFWPESNSSHLQWTHVQNGGDQVSSLQHPKPLSSTSQYSSTQLYSSTALQLYSVLQSSSSTDTATTTNSSTATAPATVTQFYDYSYSYSNISSFFQVLQFHISSSFGESLWGIQDGRHVKHQLSEKEDKEKLIPKDDRTD